ncbi:hypothetical protein OHB11_02200 [Streptomyces zaomyceticus]|uniref:PH domain-containing protein n=1 Tax=Streptomyces zaomyceticus TaxID=68286 RepID=A0ABZ1L442_9ACTN|nr:hypothetical protein OG237_39990 [Streptomyces zaomyceticus]
MTADEGHLPSPDDPAFRDWLRSLSEILDIALDADIGTVLETDLGAPDTLAFLRTAFARNGAMPTLYFAEFLGEHRRTHAERAVTALLGQVRRDTGRAFDIPVRYEWPAEREATGQVTVGHEPIHGIGAVGIAVEAAEGVQCHLADRDRLVWPLCPTHRTGTRATRTAAGAAWVCRAGAHVVASLPA